MEEPGELRAMVRREFDAATLVHAHPPRWGHANKRFVYGLSAPARAAPRGTIVYSRWRAMALPDVLAARPLECVVREDVFSYAPARDGAFEWHVNFADPNLFCAYGSPLFAQDELQVLEHPALGSLREALVSSGDPLLRPVTVEDDAPTPVLIRGVERRCALATDEDLVEGRPLGLYGNRFARANEKTIARALTVLDPPTTSNIIAMSAPLNGRGAYAEAEIRYVLQTAFTAFRAAIFEARSSGATGDIVVHTGHWGTGAFGGNRVLMAILQRIAAQAAGVDRLVYHTVDAAGAAPLAEATRHLETLVPDADRSGATARTTTAVVDDVVRAVLAMGFVWGSSDGN